jgi:hypothetical protein
MEYFGWALEKALQYCLRMSPLTQRKTDRSDNNKAGKAPYFDASMASKPSQYRASAEAVRLWTWSIESQPTAYLSIRLTKSLRRIAFSLSLESGLRAWSRELRPRSPFLLEPRSWPISRAGRCCGSLSQDGSTWEKVSNRASAQLQTFWPRLLEDAVPTQSIGPRRQSFLAMWFRIDPAAAGSKNIDLRSKFLKPLYLLSGIVALILLVVCVNLTSLTLARASARRHEISTRIALGATPWQAIRQLLVESLFLATMGPLSGLLLAFTSALLRW